MSISGFWRKVWSFVTYKPPAPILDPNSTSYEVTIQDSALISRPLMEVRYFKVCEKNRCSRSPSDLFFRRLWSEITISAVFSGFVPDMKRYTECDADSNGDWDSPMTLASLFWFDSNKLNLLWSRSKSSFLAFAFEFCQCRMSMKADI